MLVFLSFQILQPRRRALPTLHVQLDGDRFDRQRRLPAQAGCHDQSVGLEIRLVTGFRQGLEKIMATHLVMEDVFPPITTTHHLVNGLWILYAQLPWQRGPAEFGSK